jgi:uncharacterized lipoprotein YmbA
MRRPGLSMTTVAVVCLAGGCSFLAPQPDHSQFFVLTPAAEQADTAAALGDTVLGMGPILLPGYLSRPQLVRRSGETQLVFSDTEAWAEPLDRNVARVLSENLGKQLGTVEILQYPWFSNVEVDYQVPIEILRFEVQADGSVLLDARWAIRHPRSKLLLFSRQSRIRELPADSSTEAQVKAMSSALGRLSVDVAAEVRRTAASNHVTEAP